MTELEEDLAALREREARIAACSGHKPAVEGEPRPFAGPVAVAPLTALNAGAHGGVEVTQACYCGAERRVLRKGAQMELGPWSAGPPTAG